MNKYVMLSTKEREELLALPDLPEKVRKRLEKSNTRITTRSAKQKGLGFQKWLCQEIAELINEEYRPGDDDSPIDSRPGGQHGVDIILRGEAKKKFPFSVEAKNQENMNLMETINQATANTADGTDWLIAHKRKVLDFPIVIISWDLFKKLYRRQ